MEKDSESVLSLEEKKFLLNAIWDSLLAPQWTKDDLIDFGKAIFSKQKLKDMSTSTFNKVFPFLQTVSVSVGEKLHKKAEEIMADVEPASGEAAKADSASAVEEKKEEKEEKKEEAAAP